MCDTRAVPPPSRRHRPARALTEAGVCSLLAHTSEAITVVDADGHVIFDGGGGLRAIRGDRPTAGGHLLRRVHPADRDRAATALRDVAAEPGCEADLEVRVVRADGSARWIRSTVVNRLEDPAVGGIVITSRDVSGRRLESSRRRRNATHDELTGLPNREHLEHLLGLRSQEGAPTAVLLLGLDRFRDVNEARGHRAGDKVLVRAGRRLLALARAEGQAVATVNRFTADTFAVVTGTGDEAAARALAERVRATIRQPMVVDDLPVTVTASVGIALAPAGTEVGQLLQRADAALSRAKDAGRNRVAVVGRQAAEEAADRLLLASDLRWAVRDREIGVHYQPQVRLADGRVVGFEALARWDHPERGPVAPGRFVPIAEQSDLIVDLGAHVLRTAVADLAALPVPGERVVSVNVAARQLVEGDLVDLVREVLAEHGVAPRQLCLELTESALAADPLRAAVTIRQLRGLGVRIAIDDFGTGWSSLGHLKQVGPDVLKIDRSFVDGLGRDHDDTEIVRAVVGMAAAVGMVVVAEGVEHVTQAAALADLGCDVVQGWYHSAAVPADRLPEVIARLEAHATDPIDPPAAAPSLPELALQVLDHELRSPLTVIRGFVDLLTETADEAGSLVALEAIRRAATSMGATLDALAAVGRPDPLRDVQPFTEIPLDQLALEVVQEFRPVMDRKELQLGGATTGAVVLGDPHALRRILFNLLTNANKYAPADTTVAVQVEADDDRARVRVHDEGPGVPAAHVDRIFDMHHRATEVAKGFGLGLHLAREAAWHHGGDLTYEGVEGGGAVFVLELPRTRPATGAGCAQPVRSAADCGSSGR